MSKLLGNVNNYNYYLDLDTPDYDDIHDPLDEDNLWTLLTFTGCGYTLDKDVDGLQGLQNYIEIKYNIFFNDDEALEDLKIKDENAHKSEHDFFNDLHNKLLKRGLYCEPITVFNHDSIYFGSGVGCGFDSGVCGVAILSKSKVRYSYYKKRISKKLTRLIYSELSIELNHINDDNNGNMYILTKVNAHDNCEVDDLSGIYASDFDRLNPHQQLERAVNLL